MGRVFPVRQTQETDEVSGDESTRVVIPPAGVELIEAILARFELKMEAFVAQHVQWYLATGSQAWAVILFDAEFPLAGHVAQLRGVRRNLALTSYTWEKQGRPPIVPGSSPTVSMITVRKKAILKHVAERSPLFAPAWEVLKDKSEDRQWFCVSDSPPAEWVQATSVGDEELFFQCRKKVDVVCRDPSCVKNQAVRDAYATGVMAYYGHDWADSVRAIRTAIEGEPDLPEAWHILGISQLSLGQNDAAIYALTKAHEMEPLWIPTLGNLACAYSNKKRYGKALELFQQVLEIDPFDEEAWRLTSRTRFAAGQTNRALEAMQKYLELNHRDADGWQAFSRLLYEEGRNVESVNACEKVTRLQPDQACSWNDFGFMLASVGRCDEAVKACKKALELNPAYGYAWDSLGYAQLMAGEYDKAIASLLKAIELRSDHAAAWRHLLHAYKRSGKEDLFSSAHAYAASILPKEVSTVDVELVTGKIS